MRLVLLVVALILTTVAIYKSVNKDPVIETARQTDIINSSNKLEIQIEKQDILIHKLEKDIIVIENNIKVLEKRHQAHTDLIKRMCEYIIVITVDKKIIPRQCLPEYKWGKEENGN